MEMEFENIIKELIKIDGEDKTFASPKVQNYIRKMLIKRGYLIHELNKYKSFNFEPYNNIIDKMNNGVLTTISTIPGADIEMVANEIERRASFEAVSFAAKHSEYIFKMAEVVLNTHRSMDCICFLKNVCKIPDEIKLRLANKVYEENIIDDMRDYLELENVPQRDKIEKRYLENIDIYKLLNYSKTANANIKACSNAILNSHYLYYDWQDVNYDFVKMHQYNPDCDIERHLKVAKKKFPHQIKEVYNGDFDENDAKKCIEELKEIYNFHKLSDKDKKEFLKHELEK